MTSMTMCMQFATSVRFGTGLAADGLDEVLDHEQPISSAAIKGVLRDEARWLLPGTDDRDHPFVMSVFGGPQGEQCPWNFQVTQPSTVRYQSRTIFLSDSSTSDFSTETLRFFISLSSSALIASWSSMFLRSIG